MEIATRLSRPERALALVQLCIERTKDHPFSFSFQAAMYAMVASQLLYAVQILETLVAHAERWRAAYLIADLPGEIQKSLNKAKGRFGQLHTLQLICIPSGGSCHIASDLFEDAPNLTRASVVNYQRLRLSSVTVLHIELWSLSTYRFFSEFGQMTSLEELVIRGVNLDFKANVPVELLSLKTFSVDYCFPLSLIKAPSLEVVPSRWFA